MQTILTLRLDTALIERAKRYSRLRHKSVSQLVADYFVLLSMLILLRITNPYHRWRDLCWE